MRSLGTFLFILLMSWASFAQDIVLTSTELQAAIGEYVTQTVEAQKIREAMGEEVADLFLYGGAAARIAYAVKAHIEDPSKPLPNRLINLLSYSQDLDVAIDLPKTQAEEFQPRLEEILRYKLGDKSRFQVSTLYPSPQRGLLQNLDITRQNTDSLSTGMIRLVEGPASIHSHVVDILNPRSTTGGAFLESVRTNHILYYDHPEHHLTQMASQGKNPKAISAVKYLVNVIRFSADASEADLNKVRRIIARFFDQLKRVDKSQAIGNWEERLNYDFFLDRLDLNLIKGLLEAPNLPEALQAYEAYGLLELSTFIQDRFPPEDADEIGNYELLDTDGWLNYLTQVPFQSLDRLSLRETRISEVEKIPHGMLMDGSFDFGGMHAPMFVDKQSFEYYAYRMFNFFMGKRKTKLDKTQTISLAEKYYYYVKDLTDKEDLGDIAVKFLSLPQYECEPDCRNDAISFRLFLELLGYENDIVFSSSHAENYVELNGRYYSVGSYDTDPEYYKELFSPEDRALSQAELDEEKAYDPRVSVPQEEIRMGSLAVHGQKVAAFVKPVDFVKAASYLVGFFEEYGQDPQAAKFAKGKLLQAIATNPDSLRIVENTPLKGKVKKFDINLSVNKCMAVSNTTRPRN